MENNSNDTLFGFTAITDIFTEQVGNTISQNDDIDDEELERLNKSLLKLDLLLLDLKIKRQKKQKKRKKQRKRKSMKLKRKKQKNLRNLRKPLRKRIKKRLKKRKPKKKLKKRLKKMKLNLNKYLLYLMQLLKNQNGILMKKRKKKNQRLQKNWLSILKK